MLAYGMLLVTRCLLISVHRSSVADLYVLLADQLSLIMYCSLIATRLMVLLASCSWTYAALSILLLIDIHPHSRQLFSLKILVARRWLYDIYSTLLPSCYWQRVTHCNLFAICCPITIWFLLLSGWTPSFSLLAHRRSPLIGSILTTMPLALPARSSRIIFRFFLFSTPRWTNRCVLLVVNSERFAACHSLLQTRFLVAQCWLLANLYNTGLLMFTARDWPLKPCF